MHLTRLKFQGLTIVLFFLSGGCLGLMASPGNTSHHEASIQDAKPKERSSHVKLEYADTLSYDARLRPGVQTLVGNVFFRHGNATMKCDSANLNEGEQTFEAFGNVHMIQGDTVNIYARYLHYDGFTRLARLRQDVRLENSTTQIFTDSLDYDRVADMAYYFEGGSVVDAQNTLTSDYGQYFPKTHDAEFRHNVHLVNDSTDMTTEHLFYNTDSRIAHYRGESEIRSDSGVIISTRGIYDLNQNVGILLDRSEVYSGNRLLIGDSVYYDGATRFGEAFGRVELHDTLQKASLYGDYGYFEFERNYAFATSRAYAVEYSQKDTLYVGADTLELISLKKDFLSEKTADSQEEKMERHLRAYRNVRVYRQDAQAVADSMTYSSVDSILTFFGRPVMWSQARQLTGDTTVVYFKDQKLDYVDVLGNAFSIEQMPDEKDFYNQLKGANLRAYIQDSTVRQLDVTGGAVESIYYMKEENAQEYSGMNRMLSSEMHVTLDSGVIKKVLWLGEVKAKVYPILMSADGGANRLDGFAWMEESRPQRAEDVISSGSLALSYTLADLRKFSGARAALNAYALYEAKKEEQREPADSLTNEEGSSSNTHLNDYKYIMRDTGVTSTPTVRELIKKILSLEWLYNPFSVPSDQGASSTVTSTGMLVERPSTEESSVSVMN